MCRNAPQGTVSYGLSFQLSEALKSVASTDESSSLRLNAITVTPRVHTEAVIGVAEIRAQLSSVVRALEPDAVALRDALPLWEDFDAIERLAAAGKTLMARRVEQSRAWARAGHRSAAEFMADRSGSSVGAARTQLETSQKLGQLPATEQRLRNGAMSGAKVAAVVVGASANPKAEQRLLDRAERSSLKELCDEALRAALPPTRIPTARSAGSTPGATSVRGAMQRVPGAPACTGQRSRAPGSKRGSRRSSMRSSPRRAPMDDTNRVRRTRSMRS